MTAIVIKPHFFLLRKRKKKAYLKRDTYTKKGKNNNYIINKIRW